MVGRPVTHLKQVLVANGVPKRIPAPGSPVRTNLRMARELLGLDKSEAGPLDLIVIDGLSDADRRLLAGLEALSEEVDAPVLAVTTFCGTLDWQGERDLLRGGLSLRPGSLRLHLSRQEPEEDRAPSEEVPLWVDVYRAGEGFHMSIGLKMLTRCRWIEETEPG